MGERGGSAWRASGNETPRHRARPSPASHPTPPPHNPHNHPRMAPARRTSTMSNTVRADASAARAARNRAASTVPSA